jgi:two-component system, NtrC family, sensor kinase
MRPLLRRMIGSATSESVRGRLFFKYVAVLMIVCTALFAFVVFEIWISYQQLKRSIIRIEQEQAQLAAAKINQFVKEIEVQLGWTTNRPWTTPTSDQQQLNLWRLLLRQVPAITDAALLDATGREQIRVSRQGLDQVGSDSDFSTDPKFVEAIAHRVYYSPIYFRSESEPYMTLALARVSVKPTVSVAEVNLKFIWDTITQFKVGENGYAYVIDQRGRLIAHPDLSLVLRNTNLSNLTQVRAAKTSRDDTTGEVVLDFRGRRVLTAYAPVAAPGWFVFVELPVSEAFAPLYDSIMRAIVLLVLGATLALLVGLFLLHRIVRPLEQLEEFTATVRSTKNYNLRFNYSSRDEIGKLVGEFNHMLAELAAARDREIADHAELARAERLTAMAAMTASIAHEINQPLAAMVTNANAGLRWMTRVTPDLDETRKALQSIVGDGQRAADVINGIRAMFKADEQTPVSLDLNQLIHEVLALGQNEIQKHTIAVYTKLDEALPPVTVNRVQLQQVIFNLVMNAIDAMASVTDRKRILQIKSKFDIREEVHITIEDSGTGIDPKNIERIFKAFYTTKTKGMGIGLSICRSIIEFHGGRLWASQGNPHGAVFHVVLPRRAAGDLRST